MQISHAETEAEVVISNFSDLQSVVHLLKTNAEDYSTSSLKMKEMDKGSHQKKPAYFFTST